MAVPFRLEVVAILGVLAVNAGAAAMALVYAERVAQVRVQVDDVQRYTVVTSEITTALLNAETGQRGYLLVGQPSYLAPYREALREIPGLLAEQTRWERTNPQLQAEGDHLKVLVLARLADLDETLQPSSPTADRRIRPGARRGSREVTEMEQPFLA